MALSELKDNNAMFVSHFRVPASAIQYCNHRCSLILFYIPPIIFQKPLDLACLHPKSWCNEFR